MVVLQAASQVCRVWQHVCVMCVMCVMCVCRVWQDTYDTMR